MSASTGEVGLDGRPLESGPRGTLGPGGPPGGRESGAAYGWVWRGSLASLLGLLALGTEVWGGGSRLGAVGLIWLSLAGLPSAGSVLGRGGRSAGNGSPFIRGHRVGSMAALGSLGLALPPLAVAAILDRKAGMAWGEVLQQGLSILLFTVVLAGAAARAERAWHGGVRGLHAALWWLLLPGLPLLRFALDDAARPGRVALGPVVPWTSERSPLSWVHRMFLQPAGEGAFEFGWSGLPWGPAAWVGLVLLATAWDRG